MTNPLSSEESVHSRRSHGGAVLAVAIAAAVLISFVGAALAVEVLPAAATTQGDLIVSKAASQAGLPYCYGGGGINGPSAATQATQGCAPGQVGYDCMSLAQYAVYQVTGIAIPSDGTQPVGVGMVIPQQGPAPFDEGLLPGDVTYWGGSLDNYYHSGIYAGNGMVWDSYGDASGVPVQEHSMTYLEQTYNYDGAIRFWNALAVATTSLPGGTLYSSSERHKYSATLAATGGNGRHLSWSVIAGSLPTGLKLNRRGVISGKARGSGTYAFTVEVMSKNVRGTTSPLTATQPLSITIT
jgi:cell wall-associated NlpC family hydrolase